MIYIDLLIGFLEVGFFSFGGGYAAIPLIRDVVTAHGWLEDEMLTYMIAVSESTPGPIMVNLATYVGSAKAGIPGAVIATAAVVLPAFVLIVLIMRLAEGFIKNQYVQAALGGLKPCIIGIILATGLGMVLRNCLVEAGMGSEAAAMASAVVGSVEKGMGMVEAGMGADGVLITIGRWGIDIKAVLLTCVLAAVYFGSRRLLKKGLSPICLICIAAVLGAVAYGG